MDEILSKLLESDLLTEETRGQLKEQLEQAAEKLRMQLREEVEVEVRADLTQQFVEAREELVDGLDQLVESVLKEELDELKADIEQYRDLEVEYAEKAVAHREELAEQLKTELDQLVDKLDQFLELEVTSHFEELREDLEQAQRDHLGRQIFEAFEETFRTHRQASMPDVERQLAEAQDQLADAKRRLREAEKAQLAEARQAKLSQILAPLSGLARKQMDLMLENVSTDRLEQAYKLYMPKVLANRTAEPEARSRTQLTEGQDLAETELLTGDRQAKPPVKPAAADEDIFRMRRLAGVN